MKVKNTLSTIRRLMQYVVGRHKGLFAIVVIAVFLSSVTTVISSLFMEVLIDDYITPMLTQVAPDYTALLRIVMLVGVIYLAGTICTLIYNKVIVWISQGTLKKIRDDMFTKQQGLPIRYFDTHSHGDIMSHYTNDTDTLRQFISQSLPMLISSIVTIVVILAAMLMSNVALTIVVLVFTILMVIASQKVGGSSARYFIRQQDSLGGVTGYIEEMLNGQKVIKVFCHEEASKAGFVKKNDALCSDASKALRYGNVLMPIIMQLGNLQYVLIALLGGLMALNGIGGVTVGMIVAFLNLSKAFCNPVSQIAQQITMIAMALAGAERIFALIDEEPETDDGDVTLVHAVNGKKGLEESDDRRAMPVWKVPDAQGHTALVPLTGDIRLKDVDFGYNPDKQVLYDVSLFAKPGQKIAFVGATGAGKTTITNLINRFYDINDGSITYDGIDISRICKPDLRRSLGIVLQDVNLFTGTVMDNIRYGRLDATDEECMAAAKLAGADSFIENLPDKYNTMLTHNGASLSQGQRQLISIARAAVADPPVMVMDEATSSIDTRTEALVQQGMDNLMKGRTVFVIAHRLSTVRNSDAIMVLDHGHIIERGSHDELIAQKGVYYRLYTGAFELE